jgi:hypothetical protein
MAVIIRAGKECELARECNPLLMGGRQKYIAARFGAYVDCSRNDFTCLILPLYSLVCGPLIGACPRTLALRVLSYGVFQKRLGQTYAMCSRGWDDEKEVRISLLNELRADVFIDNFTKIMLISNGYSICSGPSPSVSKFHFVFTEVFLSQNKPESFIRGNGRIKRKQDESFDRRPLVITFLIPALFLGVLFGVRLCLFYLLSVLCVHGKDWCTDSWNK